MEIKPLTNQRVVTAAGTPEKIKEAPEYTHNQVTAIQIRAHAGNTGNIFICREDELAAITTSGYILAAGEVLSIDVSDQKGDYLDLAHLWIDAAVNGEGISYIAREVGQ